MFNGFLSLIGNKYHCHKPYQQQQDLQFPKTENWSSGDIGRSICFEQKRSSVLKDKTFRALILLNVILFVVNGVGFVKLCKGTAHSFSKSESGSCR